MIRAMEPDLKVVELFCGIGGFRLAAESLGLRTVWANDSSAVACEVYRSRFGENELTEGDVREHWQQIPPHDMLTAGLPCQPFSSAGKKEGLRDPRGTLFEVVLDVLERQRPRFFVVENVKRLLSMERGEHFATILASFADAGYAVEWRLLNAMDFGLPQNRQRVIIAGVACKALGGDADAVWLAPADDLATSDQITHHRLAHQEFWTPIAAHGRKFPTWGMARNGAFIGADLPRFSSSTEQPLLKDILEAEVDERFDFTASTLERIKESEKVGRLVEGVEILYNQGGGARMGYTVFGTAGVAPALTATASRHYERYRIGQKFRRLTNVEYARIQGFPDDHCSAVSVHRQYGLYGNAVPPAMVEWAMDRLIRREAGLPAVGGQMELLVPERGRGG